MQFNKIGVVGAGTMGAGITQKIAQENIPVVLVDIKQEFVDRGLDNIKKLLQEGVEKKIFTSEKSAQILQNVTGTTDINALKDADLVIEAVFEDQNVKKDLFKNLDSICEAKTILASNTSSFSISSLAAETKRPDRFIGLHYFYHPAKNRLLEIVPGKKTSAETLARAAEFASLTGKTAIVVQDTAGFAVNRFFVPWLNESVRILEEGLANIPTIDEATKRVFKIGMGPFLLMNVTGIPIAYHSTVTLGEKFGSFYAPAKKLKEQFESQKKWQIEGKVDESKMKTVTDRLLGTIFLVAAQLVDEGVASIEDTDRAAKIGLRWALGPFELMNKFGLDQAYPLVKNLTQKYGLKVPGKLEKQWLSKSPWEFRWVDLSVTGNIATITVNRPEAMNALNEVVVRQLAEVFTQAEQNPDVKAIVLEGKGKAFIAGADIGFFVKNIKNKSIDRIIEFTKKGQDLLLRIDKSPKLVIAKLDGLALGGGAELALAADVRLMTERGTLGFPETGIGIYPGLAGTQRLPRLVGSELAKYLILTGDLISGPTAQEMGLVEAVRAVDLNQRIRNLVDNYQSSAVGQETIVPSAKVDPIKSLFSSKNIQGLLTGKFKQSANALEARMAKKISYKAPVALQLANQLIDQGLTGSLEEGIKLELSRLPEIFATRDAYEGLTSILQRRRPTFEGK